MAYNPYIYGGYQPGYYGQPMPDQMAQLRQSQMQPQQPASNGIIWVQGEEGAKAYMVAPGNSVLLMDSENSSFYIKSTDSSGMPMPLRAFDYTERTAAPKTPQSAPQTQMVDYVTREEYDALAARVEALAADKTAKPARKTVKEETENG